MRCTHCLEEGSFERPVLSGPWPAESGTRAKTQHLRLGSKVAVTLCHGLSLPGHGLPGVSSAVVLLLPCLLTALARAPTFVACEGLITHVCLLSDAHG